MRNERTLLLKKIALLEEQQTIQREALRLQADTTFESIKPINIIKNTLLDVVSSPNIKNTVLNNVLGFGTGLLSKKIVSGVSHHPLANLAGTALQMAVSNIVTNNPGGIITLGKNILGFIFKPKQKKEVDS